MLKSKLKALIDSRPLCPPIWVNHYPKPYQISGKLCRHNKELSVLISNTCMMLCHVQSFQSIKNVHLLIYVLHPCGLSKPSPNQGICVWHT